MKIVSLASSSSGNAHLVDDGHTKILLDCGLRFTETRKRIWSLTGGGTNRFSDISACFVSHEHLDHSRCVEELTAVGLDVWASKGTLKAIGLRGSRARPLFSFCEVGTWEIMSFRVEHGDAAEPRGFYLRSTKTKERLLYVTDTAYVVPLFTGLTHIMVGCNWSERLLRPARDQESSAMRHRVRSHHMSLERVIDMLRANDLSKVQEIHLLHLSDGHSDEVGFRDAVEKAVGRPTYVAGA